MHPISIKENNFCVQGHISERLEKDKKPFVLFESNPDLWKCELIP